MPICSNISNVLCVIGAPLLGSTLAPRRSIAFRNSAGTWSRAPGKQFGVLGQWRDRHTRPAWWSDTLRIRPVRWRKWNRIRIESLESRETGRPYTKLYVNNQTWILRSANTSTPAANKYILISRKHTYWWGYCEDKYKQDIIISQWNNQWHSSVSKLLHLLSPRYKPLYQLNLTETRFQRCRYAKIDFTFYICKLPIVATR